MQKEFTWLYKLLRMVIRKVLDVINKLRCKILFFGQNVQHGTFITEGLPYVSVAFGGICIIGDGLDMNNTLSSNPIGRSQPCVFFVDKDAKLVIGKNVGMSQAALNCHFEIIIGDNVKLGGGVCIYDSDFHSIFPEIRKIPELDIKYRKKAPVTIKNNAFIGAHSTILKGVTIGENSVIGACSLVTKDVPDNQVWGGNPAKLIKIFSEKDISINSIN